MRVLLLSTYESGHQPLHLALPAAHLRSHGHEVDVLDLAVDPIDWHVIDAADAVACSVPMHTAMVLGSKVARMIADRRPGIPIAFYGLYAALAEDRTLVGMADRLIAGEYLDPLLEWLDGRATESLHGSTVIRIARGPSLVPDRSDLPTLDQYAHLTFGGDHRRVGYVESSHGCRHECRHCPIPVVYGGRFRTMDIESLRADVDQLVAMGAQHVTLGDPDFLNGPAHAERLLAALHGDHPQLTYDVTVKVEHILQHAEAWPRLASLGVIFVVSAYETIDDRTLRLMDKGHTAADLAPATRTVRAAGIEVRPSLLPFTPWTELDHLPQLFSFLSELDLLGSVDPVQMSIRLLIPEGSLLLELPETRSVVTHYDPTALSYQWSSRDPRVDLLQQRLAEIADEGSERDNHESTLLEQWAAVVDATSSALAVAIPAGASVGRPRLTEPWFC